MLRAIAIALALAGPAAAQETVVTGVSTDNIALTADFNGSEIFVFGAIRREGPLQPDSGALDIVITIKGPAGPVRVRRKDRRFGVWVNTDAVRVRDVPSFYALATTRTLNKILSETERQRYGIGMDQAVRKVGGHPTLTDTREFAQAVVRLRAESGHFEELDGGVSVAQETLFQARFRLPANLVEGAYFAEFFLIRDWKVIHTGVTSIAVEKTGIERWIFNLSRERPLVYGLLSVLVALVVGWLAAIAFRLARR